MNHLDNITLNEYLDHTLDESERSAADVHLQSCVECQAGLDQIQAIFTELDTLPEAQLERDLVSSVLARLPQRTPIRLWTRAFAAQLGVAIGSMFWLAMQAVPFIRVPKIAIPTVPAIDIQALFMLLLAFQLPMPHFKFPSFSYQLPTFEFQIPTIAIEFSTMHMIVLFVSVALLWAVGNVVLLRSRQEGG